MLAQWTRRVHWSVRSRSPRFSWRPALASQVTAVVHTASGLGFLLRSEHGAGAACQLVSLREADGLVELDGQKLKTPPGLFQVAGRGARVTQYHEQNEAPGSSESPSKFGGRVVGEPS